MKELFLFLSFIQGSAPESYSVMQELERAKEELKIQQTELEKAKKEVTPNAMYL